MGSFTNWQTYLQYACTCTVCWIIRNQLFWWTAIAWMSISFSMTDLPQESHGAVLDPQILSCSHIFRSRSRTSSGCPPAWTVSPQNRHTIKRKGQVEDWCWTYHRRTNQVRIVWLKNRYTKRGSHHPKRVKKHYICKLTSENRFVLKIQDAISHDRTTRGRLEAYSLRKIQQERCF
jgi:hypothetical protein